MSARIKELQQDLKTLGFDPGKVDGLWGPKTQRALESYAESIKRLASDPDLAEQLARDADAKTKIHTNLIIQVEGDPDDLKDKVRDFSKQLYLQIHQTDYWPGERCASMKTNLYVSCEAVYEVHPVEQIVDGNYSDFVHIETAWVSESRKTVPERGKIYHRLAGVWTPEREALLERGIVYAVEQCRERGQDPILITHRQTYKSRAIDPDPEIAQAAYRIAVKHSFRLDYDWVRPSGRSAALWYPAGCGRCGVRASVW